MHFCADKHGMIDFSTPLSGMTRAETSVNEIASQLAKPSADRADFSSQMLELMSAKDSFAMDTKIAQTEDQMTQHALSLIG
jgi:hypothetical protein